MRLQNLVGLAVVLAAWAAPITYAQQTPPSTLDGSWVVSAAEQSGKPFDAIKGGVLKIDGTAFDLSTASGNHLNGMLRLDSSVKPASIDFLLSNGEVWEGIYAVSGDTFRLNYVERADGVPRPTVFATAADKPGTVIVMRRTTKPE